MIDLKYNAKGSIADGTLIADMPLIVEEVQDEIGEYAVDEIRARFKTVLRNPTGYLSDHVTYDPDPGRVTDGGVIYGPWIEGVSRRNARSRFKGYKTFRTVAQKVRQDAPQLAERVIDRALGRHR